MRENLTSGIVAAGAGLNALELETPWVPDPGT